MPPSSFLPDHDGALSLPKLAVAGVAAVVSAYALNFWSNSKKSKSKEGNTVVRPPHVSTFLHYIGSALEMGQGITPFIRKYATKFQSPVFTATILGNHCLFIADPELLTVVYKPTLQKKKLDDISLQKQFMRNALGMTDADVAAATHPVPFKEGLKQYQKHLFKGEYLQVSMTKVQDFFRTVLIPSLASCDDSSWTTCNLYQLVQSAVFKASVGPFFSPALATDEAVRAFQEFDAGATLLFQNVPSFLTRTARAGRESLLNMLQQDAFWETAAPLMAERKEAGTVTGIVLDRSNLGVLWASSGNSVPAIFWTFLHLVNDRRAWDACFEQVKSIAKTPDHVFTLEELDQMTCLQSAFWESLRLYHGAFTSRIVVEDFVLETNAVNNETKKYLIEEKTQIMSFWDILHSDPNIFESPNEYRYDRFLNKEKPTDFTYASGKPLSHPPVMAFGGGNHYCPGRKFIAYENRLMLAMLMLHFDVRLVEGERIPIVNLAAQGIGVSQPSNDVKIEIRRKL